MHGVIVLGALTSVLAKPELDSIYSFWTLCDEAGELAIIATRSAHRLYSLPIFARSSSLLHAALCGLAAAGMLAPVRTLACIPLAFQPAVERLYGAERVRADPFLVHVLPGAVARAHRVGDEELAALLPAGAELGPVRLSEAQTLLDLWPYGRGVPVSFAESIIQHSITRCVRVDGVIAAWLVRYLTGDIGMATTVPEHRRKGFAAVCLRSLLGAMVAAGEAADGKRPITCFIARSNAASLALFRAQGFEPVVDVTWTDVDAAHAPLPDCAGAAPRAPDQ